MTRWLTIFVAFCLSSVLAAQTPIPLQKYATFEPAGSSVLAEGRWFKMKILSTGIYKLTYEDLVAMGFSDPSDIGIFGNGGSMVPLMNSKARYDDLVENRIFQDNGNDGIFNQGDFILFYAQGPVLWSYNESTGMFEQQIHQFSNAAWYFVSESNASGRMNVRPAIPGTPTVQIHDFDDFNYHEKNKYNFIESGRQWFGERIDLEKGRTYDTTFVFKNLVAGSPVKVKVNAASRSSLQRAFSVLCNESFLGKIELGPVTLTNKTGAYATQGSDHYGILTSGDQVNIKVAYSGSGGTEEGYLDYITVNARRSLILTGDYLFFRDNSTAGTGSLVQYSVENCTEQTEIWDITDPFHISKVTAHLNGTTLTFADSTNVLKQYVALNTRGAFPKPVINTSEKNVGFINNQNLHGLNACQMLIVTNPRFQAAADSIALFHRLHDNLSVEVVTTDQIYNEFSSGAPDVSAIRDFARMIYNRSAAGDKLRYLLFVGDGSYNNLSPNEGNSNFIPTYQSENSINASYSYVSDDFFGLLEPDEGGSTYMEDFTLDLGIGRLPVKTAEEAMDVYRKIKSYADPKNKGDWQNNVLFAADDQDGNLHMSQADELATWVDSNHPEIAIKKVYIDAYPRVSTTTGARYPDAKQAIINTLQKGVLIFNYTGHGSENGLADEQILMREDLTSLTNLKHLPLFITATCEFSRFDDLTRENDGALTESTSAGELSLLSPTGGSIALITTTRIVYSGENHALNRQIYQTAFSKDPSGNYYRLGDIIKMSKNVLVESRNKLNFILLGDPALTMAIPSYKVITDSINHISVSQPIDTLKAFSRITISGHISDQNNNALTGYNGTIYPSVYDKSKTITTLANAGNTTPMQFQSREDLLYRGKITVVDGKFSFEFVVPKDITYNYGNGRIVYFSTDYTSDAKGEFSNVIIGGTDVLAGQDVNGPEIELYMNDENFNDKGITNPNPVILAAINDESGINTIGSGIGHDITGIIDGDVTSPVIMNEYFQANLNDYTSGNIVYPMFNLSVGTHTLTVRVWDVYNNSSQATITFRVVSGKNTSVSRAFNYPNPARDFTTFNFEHNRADKELTVTISVYDLSGRLIYTYNGQIQASGFNSSLPEWDLRDSSGNLIKPGIYPWRLTVTDENGSSAVSYQKLAVVR